MQVEIDRLRDSVHDLRSRVVALEMKSETVADVLRGLQASVSQLARKDEIEAAVTAAGTKRRGFYLHTWQGALASLGGVLLVVASILQLWDRIA